MAVPLNTEAVPSYVVYRDIKPGEPFDPTSPLLFFPPKGSDELFDALRVAFPNVKTHSERMRDAMIQYLLEERQQEEQLASPAATMDTMPTAWPSMSSDSNSTWSSPELLNFPTPAASFSNSPQLAPELTRQTSSIATSSQPSPSGPSLDQMTGVFCLSTSSQPKQRVRRKMTDAEKAEYRKRRIVKACDKCAKRKRKCPHNQAEMASVPNKPTSRAAKSASKSATPPSSAQSQAMAFDAPMSLDTVASTFDPSEFIGFGDFNMFDDTYPELDMNDMVDWNQNNLFTPDVSPLQRDWSHGSSRSDEFTLLDPRASGQMEFYDMNSSLAQAYGDTLHDHNSGGEQQSLDHLNRFANFADVHAFPKSVSRDQQGDRSESQQEQNIGGTYNGGNGMLWEHLRTGQEPRPEKPVPTHTAHVHDAESGALQGLNNQIGRPQEPCRQHTLAQTVLRLTGTAKATRTFLSLTGDRTRPSSTSSMECIVDALHDRDLLTTGSLSQLRIRGTNSVPAHLQRTLLDSSLLREVGVHASAQPDEVDLAGSGPLRDRSGKSGSRRIVSSLLGGSSTPLTFTSVSVSRGSLTRPAAATQGWPQSLAETNGMQPEARSSTLGRQQPSLGEGIPEDANPASELYMARRRISPRLNRWTDVNTAASVNAGVPGKDELCINRTARNTVPTAQSVSRAVDAVRLETRSTRGLPEETNIAPVEDHSTASQANGGAYQRLEKKETPVHTRSRNPTASGFSGDTDQYHDSGSTKIITASRAVASSTAQAVASGLQAHEERLSDHVRYRDHHGRTTIFSVPVLWVAVFGSLFMLSLAVRLAGIVPSLALLALVSVEKENEAASHSHVRCSTKNSSWLSTYASMQLGSAGSSSSGRGNEKAKKESLGVVQQYPAWIVGLIHPFALAPVCMGAGA